MDNLEAACQRFEDKGVTFKKKLSDGNCLNLDTIKHVLTFPGRMNNIAFILDPDNYWIEVIANETLKSKI